jgi:hypothetical protein
VSIEQFQFGVGVGKGSPYWVWLILVGFVTELRGLLLVLGLDKISIPATHTNNGKRMCHTLRLNQSSMTKPSGLQDLNQVM